MSARTAHADARTLEHRLNLLIRQVRGRLAVGVPDDAARLELVEAEARLGFALDDCRKVARILESVGL